MTRAAQHPIGTARRVAARWGGNIRTLGQTLGVIFPSICYSEMSFYFSSSCQGFVP
jgi:hypothetical protein